jgi:hypothetical protein
MNEGGREEIKCRVLNVRTPQTLASVAACTALHNFPRVWTTVYAAGRVCVCVGAKKLDDGTREYPR